VRRNTVARWERGELRVARRDWLDRALADLEAALREAPAESADATRSCFTKLPCLGAELSSFVGRQAEVAECCAKLGDQGLVTLTGAGGMGKSRLARKVAQCAASRFSDGVYLVELGALEQSTLVPCAVAAALGIAERSDDAMIELLIENLRSRRLLLVMDDCDHHVEACGRLVDRLLRGVPCLSILATCRERLDVRGEIVVRVPSLSLPMADTSFDEISGSESVQLFVERVRAVSPWFKLTTETAPGVAKVCRRLDGIPLALELAAARMKALSLDQLVVRLECSFDLLTGGSRTAPSRQQTLRATVDWSYQLLNDSERTLYRRLSVFAGGWSLDAAERVAGGHPLVLSDTLNLLERLIDKSLVGAEERLGTIRMTMLETLREYAHERLVESGEELQVRRCHVEWLLDLVESINPDELTPRKVAVMALDVENLRSALAWCIATGDTQLALRLAAAAGQIWNYRGHFAEGIGWLQRTLDLSGAAEPSWLRARVVKLIGVLQYGLGEMVLARSSITQSCFIMAEAGVEDERKPPFCSQLLGDIARATGDLAGALRLLQQALSEYGEHGLRFWEEVTLCLISSVLFEQGDYAASRAASERCVALGSERQFAWATSRARVILAYLAQHEGDDASAERLALEALGQQRALGEPTGTGISLRALSQFALEQGHPERAWSYLAEAFEIARVAGDRMALARSLETLACLLAGQAPDRAAQIAGAASMLRARTGTTPWPSEQARLTRWLDVARRKIGKEAFEGEWRMGQTLTDARAISIARESAGEVLVSPRGLTKSAPDESPLTARQREVVALVARGLTNEQIGEELVISPATARAHVEHVLDRLDLHSRTQVAAWAGRHSFVGAGRT
jgi:predicted ATPase/DNA-binding CsgD family transcriptional regulator